MYLASPVGIRKDLGFDDMTDINAAIGAALNAAEAQLASVLQTRFDKASVTDTFWVSEPVVREPGHVFTEFLLSRGFVSGLTVQADIPVAPEAVVLNHHKGIVRDWTTHYHRTRVVFSYEAGFDVAPPDNDDPPVSYDLSQVPAWLQEAAKLTAYLHLSTMAAVQETGVTIDTKTVAAQLQAVLPEQLRYAPLALLPL